MGLPNINISFRTQASTAIQRSEKGIVALLLKDTAENGLHSMTSLSQIPETLSVSNRDYIKRAFIGYENTPRKVIAYVLPNDATDLTEGLNALATQKFDYLAGTPDIGKSEAEAVADWIRAQRANDNMVKAVLPNLVADSEAIVNFATQKIIVGEKTYTTAEYCSRIAGLIVGTPLTISCAFAPLPEVTDVDHLTKEQLNEAINAGKFILYHDGKKVKVANEVNSLTTLTSEKGEIFQDIKLVDTIDIIKSDIQLVAQDTYIGRYANSYDNKCLLISAIQEYFKRMENDGILQNGYSEVGIDLDTQKKFLYNKGIDISEMSDQDIKIANTEDKVFLQATIKILRAIKEINIDIIL